MFDFKNFYKGYQYDYYVYKALTLKKIINEPENFKNDFLKDKIRGYKDVDFIRVLKSELRQTFYHAIETAFEIIFAIYDVEKKTLNDTNILKRLSTAKFSKNYNQIKNISDNLNSTDFLDEIIKIDNKEISIGHYIFYYGISSKNYLDEIPSSIEAIKYGLRILASEFSNRAEYNSYKHGLRILPMITDIGLLKAGSAEMVSKWSLQDSMTYYIENKKESEIKFVTKKFDTERDFLMTLFCSNLISNMVYLRKAALNLLDEDDERLLFLFTKKQIEEANKMNIDFISKEFKLDR